MSSKRGFFASLFASLKEQSKDVYGKSAAPVLFFYVVFALAGVVVPIAAVAGIVAFNVFDITVP